MPDAHANFAYSTVATAPSPATSGTSLVVAAGQGALFPAVPFNATIWPTAAQPTAANAEIVRVTAISTDTLTITRAQEGSSARTVVVGDQIAATITKQTLTDIEGAFRSASRVGDYLQTAAVQSSTSAALTADRMELGPLVVPRVLGLDRIAFRIQTTAGSAGSVVRQGLYASGSDGSPTGAALLDTTAIGTATGVIETTISLAGLTPGLYWLALAGQGSPVTQPTIARMQNVFMGPFGADIANSPGGGFFQSSVSGALPTIGALSLQNSPPYMRVRVA